MRLAAACLALIASALWAVPAHAQVARFDYDRGLGNKETGVIAAVASPGYSSGNGAVGIRRTAGGTVLVRADLRLARAGAGTAAKLCVRVVEAGEWCGPPLTGGQVSPVSYIQGEFSLPSSQRWDFEVYVGATGNGGVATTVAYVDRLTVTPR